MQRCLFHLGCMQKVRVYCMLFKNANLSCVLKVCIKHIWIMGHNGWNNVNNNSAQCNRNVRTQYTSQWRGQRPQWKWSSIMWGVQRSLCGKLAVQGRKYTKKLKKVNSLWGRVIELVLSGATETSLHASILPQPLDDSSQLACHVSLICRAGQNKQLPSIILKESQSNASFSWFPFDPLSLHK